MPVHSTVGQPPEAAPASQILRELDSSAAQPLPLGRVLGAMGSRMHGVALLLLALPDTLPLPLPSTSAVLGVPLVVIAAHLVVYGEGAQLPERAQQLEVSPKIMHALARYAAPVLQFLERFSRPRLPAVVRSGRVLGLIALYLAALLLLPIPLMNAAPAICLSVLALGMIQRDGLIVLVGIGATVVLTVVLVFFAEWLGGILERVAG